MSAEALQHVPQLVRVRREQRQVHHPLGERLLVLVDVDVGNGVQIAHSRPDFKIMAVCRGVGEGARFQTRRRACPAWRRRVRRRFQRVRFVLTGAEADFGDFIVGEAVLDWLLTISVQIDRFGVRQGRFVGVVGHFVVQKRNPVVDLNVRPWRVVIVHWSHH